MTTFETLLSRKSVRQFTGEQISDEELNKILLAAYASPVGKGAYDSMHLTVIRNKELLGKIEQPTRDAFKKPGMKPLHDAPTLVLVSTKAPTGAMANVAYSNAAIIVQDMVLAATDMGIGVFHVWGVIMNMASDTELVKELGLPEGFVPCCAAAFGKTDVEYTMREIPENRIATDYID